MLQEDVIFVSLLTHDDTSFEGMIFDDEIVWVIAIGKVGPTS